MSLAIMKQKEVDTLLKEANKMLSDIQEIDQICTKFSERYETIGNAANGLISGIADGGRSRGRNTLGAFLDFGAGLAGSLISAYGEVKAEEKRQELHRKLLPKKQKIANAKLEYIEQMIPKLSATAERLNKQCIAEATMLQADFNDKDIFIQTKDQYKTIFDLYHKFTYLSYTCIFFREEFKAWLKGDFSSDAIRVSESGVFKDCVKNLREWSNIKYYSKEYSPDSPNFFIHNVPQNIATITLFEDTRISAYANMNNTFYKFTTHLAQVDENELKISDKNFYNQFIKPNFFIQNILNTEISGGTWFSIIALITGGFALGIYLFDSWSWIITTVLFFGYFAYKKYKTGEKKRDLKIDAQKKSKIREMTGHYSCWS